MDSIYSFVEFDQSKKYVSRWKLQKFIATAFSPLFAGVFFPEIYPLFE